jgi:hypothetical protein
MTDSGDTYPEPDLFRDFFPISHISVSHRNGIAKINPMTLIDGLSSTIKLPQKSFSLWRQQTFYFSMGYLQERCRPVVGDSPRNHLLTKKENQWVLG